MTTNRQNRRYLPGFLRVIGLMAGIALTTAGEALAQGAGFAILNDRQAAAVGMQPAWGAIVAQVDPSGAAARGGMRLHDVIVGVDGYRVTNAMQLAQYLNATGMGGGRLTFVMFCPHRREQYQVVADYTGRGSGGWSAPQAPAAGPGPSMPAGVPSYVHDYNRMVAQAQELARQSAPPYSAISSDPVLGAAQFANSFVSKANSDYYETTRLIEECRRGVPGACERGQQLAERQRQEAARLGGVAAVQGAHNAAAEIGNSINRQNQQRIYSDQRTRALSQADYLDSQAEAALNSGRADVAQRLFIQAAELRASVSGYPR
jgi:hypothetical protein